MEIKARESGYIKSMDTSLIGKVSGLLGAGRATKEDTICYQAGIIVNKKTSDHVNKGDVLATIYTNKKEVIDEATTLYLDSIKMSKIKVKPQKLILGKIK